VRRHRQIATEPAIHQHFLAHPVLPMQGRIHAAEQPGLGMDLDPAKIVEETEAFA
jgi:L-alanine-DL-glutamate epimerase-like enolase superfamily enzyme